MFYHSHILDEFLVFFLGFSELQHMVSSSKVWNITRFFSEREERSVFSSVVILWYVLLELYLEVILRVFYYAEMLEGLYWPSSHPVPSR